MKTCRGKHFLFLLLLISLLVSWQTVFSQAGSKDLRDVYREWKKDTVQKTFSGLVVGKIYKSLLPVIGYGPANGFVAGGAVSLAKLYGEPPTSLSSGMLNCQITSKKQFIANVRTKVYLSSNKWFLQGDWRLLVFTQPTYGLGINAQLSNTAFFYINNLAENEESSGEPMRYNHVRLYEEAGRRLGTSHFYAGVGIAIDHHFGINDELLDTIRGSENFYLTKHYAYSVINKYNPEHYGVQGIKFTILTDTRDNISNCYNGYYAALSVLQNVRLGDNSKPSTQLLYDARYYLGLSEVNKSRVLAFWSWGSFLLGGTMPYLALPSIGWDTYNRSGRGYVQGRYRGQSMVYGEIEYRYPITNNRLLGGTIFVNSTTASSHNQKLFEYNAIGLGAGLRVQLDKNARTNLTVDFGLGTDHSSGIYFNLQETF